MPSRQPSLLARMRRAGCFFPATLSGFFNLLFIADDKVHHMDGLREMNSNETRLLP